MNFCVYMSDLILLLFLDEYEYEYYYGELNNDIVNETITLNVEGRIIIITKLIYYILFAQFHSWSHQVQWLKHYWMKSFL